MECPHCHFDNKDSELEVMWVECECPDYFDVECFECEKTFKVMAQASVEFYFVPESTTASCPQDT